MMTKTTLSDGRRTRPRFAAPTPTPPKFLIETPRLEIAVSGRKTSKMQNPNRDKMGVFYPPQRLNGLQWYRPARRGAASFPLDPEERRAPLCAICRTLDPTESAHRRIASPYKPVDPEPRLRNVETLLQSRTDCLALRDERRAADTHPRKPSGSSQSLAFTPICAQSTRAS